MLALSQGLLALYQGAWGVEEILILIVIICGAVGVVIIACRYFGVTIPDWLIKIIGIVVVVIVAIIAIKLIFSIAF